MEKESLPKIKVCMVGNFGTGKTLIAFKRHSNKFEEENISTVGVGYFLIKEVVGNESVMLNIFDTAGQERFADLLPKYLRNSHVICIVAAINDEISIQSIDKWKNIVNNICPDAAFFVVLNKIDIKEVEISDYESLSEKYNKIYLTSAKTGKGIDTLFSDIAARGFQIYKQKVVDTQSAAIQKKKENGCC